MRTPMTRIFCFLFGLGLLVSCTPEPAPTVTPPPHPTIVPIAERVKVHWFVGLGQGDYPTLYEQQENFVRKYNYGQGEKDGIVLVLDFSSDYNANYRPREVLSIKISNGNAPDIIGPVSTEGRGWLEDQLLDLQPYVNQSQFDLSDFDPVLLRYYQTKNGLVGLPFVIYPSALYYNKTLFKQAGLAEPPHKVGEKYVLDGIELEWNFDTVAKLAKRLTLDQAGKSADTPGFDKDKIVQYGFDFQWTKDNPRWFSTYFEPYYPVKDGKADLSAGQIAAIKWHYDGMWGEEPFIPNQAAMDSGLLNDNWNSSGANGFDSGHLAMGLTHFWYTCCILPPSDQKVSVPAWDVAVVPSYNGTTTSKLHADSFSILKMSKNPEAAFKVYQYLVGEGAEDLTKIYRGFSARKSLQAGYLDELPEKFAPNMVDTQVFQDMIPYAEIPSHELALPNQELAHDHFFQFGQKLRTEPNLNIDNAITDFVREQTNIYNMLKTSTLPTPYPTQVLEPTSTPRAPKPEQIPLSTQDAFYLSMMDKGYKLHDSGSLVGPEGRTYSAYLFFNPTLSSFVDEDETNKDALKIAFYRWDGTENVFISEQDFSLYKNKYASGAGLINWDDPTQLGQSLLLDRPYAPKPETISWLKQIYYSSDINQNGLPEFAFITEYCQISCWWTYGVELFEIENTSTVNNITQALPGRTTFQLHSYSPFTFYVEDWDQYGINWIYTTGPNGFVDVSQQYSLEYLESARFEIEQTTSLYGDFDNIISITRSGLQVLKLYEKAGMSEQGLTIFLDLTHISHWGITKPEDLCQLQVTRASAQEDYKHKHLFNVEIDTDPMFIDALKQSGYDLSACDAIEK